MFICLEMTRVVWLGSTFRHDEIAMRSDHIVSRTCPGPTATLA